MFEVRCVSPFDDAWTEREDRIVEAARKTPHFAGTNFAQRDLGWVVDTFTKAKRLKARIDNANLGGEVRVTIRER